MKNPPEHERTVGSINVIVCADAQSASQKAAELMSNAIRSRPKIVLGLATGGTPVEMYRQLAKMHEHDGLDFSNVTSFNLDEYIGLSADHPQSYRMFMQQKLFDHINIKSENTHVPDGLAADPQQHAKEFEALIVKAGGIDVQLLGVGQNGHIAFNEPGSTADSRARVIELTPATIQSNARFFASADEVPKTAITLGIGTILEAKRIVLLAIGSNKATAIHRALEGKPDISHPASLLQNHDDVTFIVDESAASLL